jgi:hypothetical protein
VCLPGEGKAGIKPKASEGGSQTWQSSWRGWVVGPARRVYGLVALLRRFLSLCLVRNVSEKESRKKLMARRVLNEDNSRTPALGGPNVPPALAGPREHGS